MTTEGQVLQVIGLGIGLALLLGLVRQIRQIRKNGPADE